MLASYELKWKIVLDRTKSKRRNDILLVILSLLLGVTLFVVFNSMQNDGGNVEVQVDGKLMATYPLGEDREINLDYNGHNLLVIKDGKATVADADCPDKLCVEQRTISKSGETIVCLPHKTVVKISEGGESEFDGVVQ